MRLVPCHRTWYYSPLGNFYSPYSLFFFFFFPPLVSFIHRTIFIASTSFSLSLSLLSTYYITSWWVWIVWISPPPCDYHHHFFVTSSRPDTTTTTTTLSPPLFRPCPFRITTPLWANPLCYRFISTSLLPRKKKYLQEKANHHGKIKPYLTSATTSIDRPVYLLPSTRLSLVYLGYTGTTTGTTTGTNSSGRSGLIE